MTNLGRGLGDFAIVRSRLIEAEFGKWRSRRIRLKSDDFAAMAEPASTNPSKRGRLREQRGSSPPAGPPVRTRNGPAEGERAKLRAFSG
jgi:hypothetical protein